jgi:dihydroxy-acid dehydratase
VNDLTSRLRSDRWYQPDTLRTFTHRSRTKQLGFAADEFVGRPVIAILNTWSDITPCHQHFRERAENVKRGVWSAGGFPLEIPALSLSEPFQKPSTMMYRNLLALETEEIIRSYPIDGAVLMGGCDKTVPGLVMGALSAGVPFVFLPAGPMLRGTWRGRPLGSGTDVWRYWADKRAGRLDDASWTEIEDGIARSAGHCMTMGTASTMTAAVDALGLTLAGASSIPAVDSGHARMAARCGRRVVELVHEGLTPAGFLTPASFDNAVTAVLALGGSTNAVIHLIAMARRAGIELGLDRFDELSRTTPVIADIAPTGRYLMEDFAYSGGLRGLLSRVTDMLALDARTVSGRTLGEELAGAEVYDDEVIRPRDRPVGTSGGLAVLRGSLAPNGAVIKPLAGEERLRSHEGPAVVFDDIADLSERIDGASLDVSENSVLVLRNAGPVAAGMPEWGMLPLPRALLARGVRDMVRISDARMSGTAYGTCVLHVAPEAAVGGPLALVRDGDRIRLNVEARSLDLLVGEEELSRRRADWQPRPPRYVRGYGKLFVQSIGQADVGCDFDFLEAGAPTPEPDIF